MLMPVAAGGCEGGNYPEVELHRIIYGRGVRGIWLLMFFMLTLFYEKKKLVSFLVTTLAVSRFFS